MVHTSNPVPSDPGPVAAVQTTADGTSANTTNLDNTVSVPHDEIPTTVQRNHLAENIIGPLTSGVLTCSMTGNINTCMFACFMLRG